MQRGTKIILHLKEECSSFSKEEHIRGLTKNPSPFKSRNLFNYLYSLIDVIKKYSNFVGYPILVNGDRINLIQPIWMEDAKNITEEQYEEFYTFIGNFDKPRFTFQYKTDSPLNIRALFYVPKLKPSRD